MVQYISCPHAQMWRSPWSSPVAPASQCLAQPYPITGSCTFFLKGTVLPSNLQQSTPFAYQEWGCVAFSCCVYQAQKENSHFCLIKTPASVNNYMQVIECSSGKKLTDQWCGVFKGLEQVLSSSGPNSLIHKSAQTNKYWLTHFLSITASGFFSKY